MNASEVMALIKSRTQRHYVYVLYRPNGAPFYVGVGTGRRILDHEIFARRKRLRSPKLSVIRDLSLSGHQIRYEIAAFVDDWVSAVKVECNLIAIIGRKDRGVGPLTNRTDGGDGAVNPSDETLISRSKNCRAAWAVRDKARAMSHLNDPLVRAKAVESRKGKRRGPYKWVNKPGPKEESRKRLSLMLKADPISRRPGIRAKIAAANRGKTWSINPETGRRVYQPKLEKDNRHGL